MFYEEEQIRNVLNCDKCSKRLDEPKVLPCGATVCSSCIAALKIANFKFDCTMCNKVHIYPADGFPTSKTIQYLLNFKPNEIPRTESVKTLQTTLNEIQHKEKADLVYWLIIIFTSLELLNIGISPLLYGWMDKNFRSELLVYFKANKNKIFRKQPLIGY